MNRKGFTLIEILIVVAIIAILASVVLVGLGPTQQAGRDARRLSDLREVQNGLELFYQNCGVYPSQALTSGACTGAAAPGSWSAGGVTSLGSQLATFVPNVGPIPTDPSSNRSYGYAWQTMTTGGAAALGVGYMVGASLENANNSAFQGYTPPTVGNYSAFQINSGATIFPSNCAGGPPPATVTDYCLSL